MQKSPRSELFFQIRLGLKLTNLKVALNPISVTCLKSLAFEQKLKQITIIS